MHSVGARTFRGLLLVTVAGSFILGGCSDSFAWSNPFSSNEEKPSALSQQVRRPANNPAGSSSAEMRAPASNPDGSEAAPEVWNEMPDNAVTEVTPPEERAAPQKKGGMFSWLYRDDYQPQDDARAPGAQPAGAAEAVNPMQRRAPQQNQQAGVQDAGGAAMAAAPVEGVDSQALAQPFTPAPMGEEMGASSAPQGFPELAEVPARPERLNKIDSAAKMAELQQAQAVSEERRAQMDSAFAPETPMAMEADPFAAEPVSMPVVPGTQPQPAAPVAMATAPSAPAADDAALNAEFASIVSGPAMPDAAPAATTQEWAPAPMVAPDTQMASAAPVAPVEEGEWVDLNANAGQSQPVDQVSVGSMPQEMAAPARPVEPVWNARDAGPVVRRERLLPDSRYAARRQAVYMQRYARATMAQPQ